MKEYFMAYNSRYSQFQLKETAQLLTLCTALTLPLSGPGAISKRLSSYHMYSITEAIATLRRRPRHMLSNV